MITQEKVWDGGRALIRALIPYVSYILCTSLFLGIGMILRHMQGNREQFLLESSNFYLFMGILFFWWRIFRKQKKTGVSVWEEITLDWHKPNVRLILLCTAFGAVTALFVSALITLLPAAAAAPYHAVSTRPAGEGDRFLVLIMLAFLAPLTEEVIFRGYMLSRLLEYFNEKQALAISSAVFALGHTDPLWILYTFAFGWILGTAALKKDNVLYAVFLHAGFNLPAVLMLAAKTDFRLDESGGGIFLLIMLAAAGFLSGKLLLAEIGKEEG